ncbi:hypothetical protein G6O69_12765 [Pseudenhygromyxa sp. WMMC2535]|uniref:hypothetical protein n=1 Tax=Pseudenhygromyxa sp. WMMC2535 TaxID=2712867 RepID=UPI001595EFE2|nr:hypothetical protein [Pseudenhygromyxa sp. WMMC2535]NVB38706.1 hypothetical protein [Pseudenhygromyxa sp. WMMC2535]
MNAAPALRACLRRGISRSYTPVKRSLQQLCRARTLLATLWLGLAPMIASAGCSAQQHAAEKLVDPRLRAQGVLLEHNAGRSRQGDLDLGGYRVSAFDLREEPQDVALLTPEASGRTRPGQQLQLRFELLTPAGARWTSACVAERRQPADHDLAAVADEAHEEIALRCTLAPLGEDPQRWTLSLAGSLDENLLGSLEPDDGPNTQADTDTPPARAHAVEVMMWRELFDLDLARKRLPASLAVVRGEQSEAALILDSPERAWLDPALDEGQRALVLTALISLRLLPLGLD